MQKAFQTALILALVALAACAHKQVYKAETAFARNALEGPSVVAQVQWLEHKSSRIEVLVRLTNEYGEAIVIRDKHASLDFNGYKAVARQNLIVVAPGMSFEQTLIFDFGFQVPSSGLAKLAILPSTADGLKPLPVIRINLPVESR